MQMFFSPRPYDGLKIALETARIACSLHTPEQD